MRQELGYKEKSGQFTKFGQWYADHVQDSQYRDAAWCDMFIAWAANKAGITEYVGEFAWTPSHAAWFIKQDAWAQQPEPGALVFFDWSGGKSYKGVDHVGVVERVEGKKIHTIEANVDRVWLKRKTRETDKVVGYGLPRLVKAGATKPDEIRSTERPFMSPPRPEAGHGSPMDILGTPPALLAAMVLLTIVLSLRVSGRRRGTHRRLPWPWNAPTSPRPDKPSTGEKTPVREKTPTRGRAPAAQKSPAEEKAREKVPARAAKPSAAKPSAAQPEQPARTRVPAGSGRTVTKHSTPTRRKPYEPS
ncbi:CHAP domain-containing protein [Nonomuraea sp. K274]|uniref:CHAP domain-containing protein n=1 Tax=Nonomuraea cypriaca TaxID=1187855 RepID=A0A931AEW1_9ACTN|nr:CHAP domain-containing protein [Nonomuraea cypriaca]MBF8187967.1 CHAP domain-containing protein [Nonomuraea cypriaca]